MSLTKFNFICYACVFFGIASGHIAEQHGFWWGFLPLVPASILVAWLQWDKQRSLERERRALNREWLKQ